MSDTLLPALIALMVAGIVGFKYSWDQKKWRTSFEDIKTKFNLLQYHDQTLATKLNSLTEVLGSASKERLRTQHGFLAFDYPPVIITRPNMATSLNIGVFNTGNFAPQNYIVSIKTTKANVSFEIGNGIKGTLAPHERKIHNTSLKTAKEGFGIFEILAPNGKIGEIVVFAVS